ncbi:MAG: hypothetical protein FWC84_04930 [Alphaproteobacteria bacterium]|nr:hypothetical protein [Alphaproteobacteria bacterium]
MTFRDDIINHADKHWNTPCADGLVGLKNEHISIAAKRRELKAPEKDGWKAVFVAFDSEHRTPPQINAEKLVFRKEPIDPKNPTDPNEILIADWHGVEVRGGSGGINDCAHFLSECFSAGGVKVAAWSPHQLISALQDRRDTKTLCEKATHDQAQKVIDTGIFQRGDLIAYVFDQDLSDDDHSAIFAGKFNDHGAPDTADRGRITCHSICRFPGRSWRPDHWDDPESADPHTFTLVHFAADDKISDPSRAKALQGWWKLTAAAQPDKFYSISEDGRAQFSFKAPSSAKDRIETLGVMAQAYWFMDNAGTITFFWKPSGDTEVWTASPGKDLTAYKSLTNGVSSSVAKLF